MTKGKSFFSQWNRESLWLLQSYGTISLPDSFGYDELPHLKHTTSDLENKLNSSFWWGIQAVGYCLYYQYSNISWKCCLKPWNMRPWHCLPEELWAWGRIKSSLDKPIVCGQLNIFFSPCSHWFVWIWSEFTYMSCQNQFYNSPGRSVVDNISIWYHLWFTR